MAKRKRTLTMTLVVTVTDHETPGYPRMSVPAIRREIRHAINHNCGDIGLSHETKVRVKSLGPAADPREPLVFKKGRGE